MWRPPREKRTERDEAIQAPEATDGGNGHLGGGSASGGGGVDAPTVDRDGDRLSTATDGGNGHMGGASPARGGQVAMGGGGMGGGGGGGAPISLRNLRTFSSFKYPAFRLYYGGNGRPNGGHEHADGRADSAGFPSDRVRDGPWHHGPGQRGAYALLLTLWGSHC